MGLLNLLTDPKNFKFYNGGQGYTGNGSVPNLKNLPYGNDRIDGGSSNQPYIQTPIPDGTNTLGVFNSDFIWRGGIEAPLNSAQDVQRLTKMFKDTKTPNGLFFVTKQEALSRSAVRTQTSPNGMNGGVYSPLNTLAQAGVVAFGGHLPKQGINPFAGTGAYSNNDNLYGVKITPQQLKSNNRLVQLYTSINDKDVGNVNGIKLNNGVNVLSYSGGPGSILSVGTTNIRYIDDIGRTGKNNYQYTTKNSPSSYFWGTEKKHTNPGSNILSYLRKVNSNGVTGKYFKLTKGLYPVTYTINGALESGYYYFNVYDPTIEGNTWPKNSPLINDQGTYTYNQQDIIDTDSTYKVYGFSPKIQDFRKVLSANISQNGLLTKDTAIKSGQLIDAPDYDLYNLEQRVRIGGIYGDGPGARANKSYANYTDGVIDTATNQPIGPLDRLNAFSIYKSDSVKLDSLDAPVNDLVKFRIAVIDNNNPNQKHFIHFRAFLDSISDSYSATWNPVQYLGRGENFYTYNGFTREISLSWTVAAQSKPELIPMYKKLNFLASSLTPDYSGLGYMRGNLAQLTIGGYIYEQPGIITGLTYTMDDNTPWEIGISTKPDNKGDLYDPSVKELAHIIKVTGFNFIPIHRFRPEIQSDENDYKQYIALANGFGEQYNKYGNVPPAGGLVQVKQNNNNASNPSVTQTVTADTQNFGIASPAPAGGATPFTTQFQKPFSISNQSFYP